MDTPPILQRHPALRWLAPLAVVCIAGLAAIGVFRASASSDSLPGTTPAALIAAVQHNHVEGFSGTVVSNLSLGLPALPDVPGAGSEDTSFGSLLSGSHTMQVWYGGIDRQRVALLGATEETDLFRNGRSVWEWSSSDGVAVHTLLPARPHAKRPAAPVALTPEELARRALHAMNPSTKVSVKRGRTVADRSAYMLVLTPRTTATKVGSVHISVDGATKVPLGVQIYPRGSSSAAIDVAFTSIHFGQQPDRNFEFTPPPNAQVRQQTHERESSAPAASRGDRDQTRIGSGWTSVVSVQVGKAAVARYVHTPLLTQLKPVSGPWGSGRVLNAPLFSVLLTGSGRIYAGAVEPAALYAAAASH